MHSQFENIPIADRWNQQQFPVPIAVAIISRRNRDEKQYLLIHRKKRPYRNLWALVGGKWEFGETLEQAIVREAQEETGLNCELTAVRAVVSERLSSMVDAQKAHFMLFVCELQVVNGKATEQAEGAVAWFSTDDINTLFAQKQIIPSDFKMWQTFANSTIPIPFVEAYMVGMGEPDHAYPELKAFAGVSQSLQVAWPYLGKCVTVEIDRPLGSTHPSYGFAYPVNYGFLPNTLAPDGEPLDAYVLGVAEPLTVFNGRCLAIVHRFDDDDDKLVVVPDGVTMSRAEIETAVAFQEQFFTHQLIFAKD